MGPNRLLERTRRASELPLRQAHVDRQARELGDCVCGVALSLHFSVSEAQTRVVRSAPIVAAVALHTAQSAASAEVAKGHP